MIFRGLVRRFRFLSITVGDLRLDLRHDRAGRHMQMIYCRAICSAGDFQPTSSLKLFSLRLLKPDQCFHQFHQQDKRCAVSRLCSHCSKVMRLSPIMDGFKCQPLSARTHKGPVNWSTKGDPNQHDNADHCEHRPLVSHTRRKTNIRSAQIMRNAAIGQADAKPDIWP